jgi:hypothetical protein
MFRLLEVLLIMGCGCVFGLYIWWRYGSFVLIMLTVISLVEHGSPLSSPSLAVPLNFLILSSSVPPFSTHITTYPKKHLSNNSYKRNEEQMNNGNFFFI